MKNIIKEIYGKVVKKLEYKSECCKYGKLTGLHNKIYLDIFFEINPFLKCTVWSWFAWHNNGGFNLMQGRDDLHLFVATNLIFVKAALPHAADSCETDRSICKVKGGENLVP